MKRERSKLGSALAFATLGLVAGGAALLLRDDAGSSRAPGNGWRPAARRPTSPAPAKDADAGAYEAAATVNSATGPRTGPTVARLEAERFEAPRQIDDVLRPGKRVPTKTLADWAMDAKLEERVRYAALRRLEQLSPSDAVTTATSLLKDSSPLVRTNAVALLARSDTPAAKDALARVDDRTKRLALALHAQVAESRKNNSP